MGPLVRAGAEDDAPGLDLPGRGVEQEAGAVRSRLSAVTVDPLVYRRVDRGRVALQVADDLVARHEAVGVVAVVVAAREPDVPIRRDETEAVPAPPPRLPHPAPLEDDVGHAGLG